MENEFLKKVRHERGRLNQVGGLGEARRYVKDGGLKALRSRPAGGGFK